MPDYALIHLSVTRQYLAERVRYLAVDADGCDLFIHYGGRGDEVVCD